MADLTPEMTALLAAVRNYLDITYTDSATDAKLVRLLNAGQAYINNTCGAELDYSVEGQAQGLLFDYVRYGRSGASEMFWTNYRHDLLALRIESGVTAYEAKVEALVQSLINGSITLATLTMFVENGTIDSGVAASAITVFESGVTAYEAASETD